MLLHLLHRKGGLGVHEPEQQLLVVVVQFPLRFVCLVLVVLSGSGKAILIRVYSFGLVLVLHPN